MSQDRVGFPRPLTTGIRSVELEMSDPERAAAFFTSVWHLREVERDRGSIYLRGTGAHHHVLALHKASGPFAIRRIVFAVKDAATLGALHERVRRSGVRSEAPHRLELPGGGVGFGFLDPESRNYAAVCDSAIHADASDERDRPRKIAHVNINAVELRATNDFLTDVLGLGLIDETLALFFFHADTPDHNSMVVCRGSKPTLNHIAFEMPDLDSVMRGAGRMRDAGYPVEWGVGRHGAGDNVFAYFAGPEECPIEYTGEVLQIDESYVPRGPDYWRFPPGRLDQWGITAPHSARWKRIQDLYEFSPDKDRLSPG